MSTKALRKETASNCYYPTFLCMNLEVWERMFYLCHRPGDEGVEAAFLHEYVHFLQDLTTISGLTKINVFADRMRWGVKRKHRKLDVPLRYDNINGDKIGENHYYCVENQGSGRYSGKFPDEFVLVLKPIKKYSSHKQSGYFKLDIEFEQKVNQVIKKINYTLGEYAISESMAYIIERTIYPDALPKPPEFPYMVIDHVVDNKFPDLATIEIKVALCDVSLSFQNPGQAFYYLCENAQKEMLENGEIKFGDIYRIGYSEEFARKLKVKRRDKDLQITATRDAFKQTEAYFNMTPLWNDLRDLLEVTFLNALWLRRNAPYFFIDILRGGPIYRNAPFQVIVSKLLGCPCIHTTQGDIFSFTPDVFPSDIFPQKILLSGNTISETNTSVDKNRLNPVEMITYEDRLAPPLSSILGHINLTGNPEWVFKVIMAPNITLTADQDWGVFRSCKFVYDILFNEGTLICDPDSKTDVSVACPLKDWCSASFKRQNEVDITSDGYDCISIPWNNCKTEERLNKCVFGRIWTAWGLDKKILRLQ